MIPETTPLLADGRCTRQWQSCAPRSGRHGPCCYVRGNMVARYGAASGLDSRRRRDVRQASRVGLCLFVAYRRPATRMRRSRKRSAISMPISSRPRARVSRRARRCGRWRDDRRRSCPRTDCQRAHHTRTVRPLAFAGLVATSASVASKPPTLPRRNMMALVLAGIRAPLPSFSLAGTEQPGRHDRPGQDARSVPPTGFSFDFQDLLLEPAR